MQLYRCVKCRHARGKRLVTRRLAKRGSSLTPLIVCGMLELSSPGLPAASYDLHRCVMGAGHHVCGLGTKQWRSLQSSSLEAMDEGKKTRD